MQLTTDVTARGTLIFIDAPSLDAGNAKDFKAAMAPLMLPGAQLALDMSKLRFVDSSGLGACLSCLRHLNQIGGQLRLYGMMKPIRALFELVRMHRIFEIYNSQEEVLAASAAHITPEAITVATDGRG